MPQLQPSLKYIYIPPIDDDVTWMRWSGRWELRPVVDLRPDCIYITSDANYTWLRIHDHDGRVFTEGRTEEIEGRSDLPRDMRAEVVAYLQWVRVALPAQEAATTRVLRRLVRRCQVEARAVHARAARRAVERSLPTPTPRSSSQRAPRRAALSSSGCDGDPDPALGADGIAAVREFVAVLRRVLVRAALRDISNGEAA